MTVTYVDMKKSRGHGVHHLLKYIGTIHSKNSGFFAELELELEFEIKKFLKKCRLSSCS